MPPNRRSSSADDLTQTTVLRLPRASAQQLEGRAPLETPAPDAPRIDWDELSSDSQLQLYREFLEGIYDAVLITNLKGWVVDANSRAAEFFLIQKRQFRGLRITDLIYGTDEAVYSRLLHDLDSGTRVILDGHCLRRDRSVFPCEITVNLIHIAEVRHVCFLIRNITRRVEAEAALRTSERRFRDISESISDWIWETDVRGIYSYCSDQATSILGYPMNELVGRSLFHYTSLEHRALGQRQFAELVNSCAAFRDFELWLLCRDNQWCCISFAGCPVLDDTGRLTGFRGIATDITEQKTRDAELEQHRHHLEDLVAQRTTELTEANDHLTREISDRVKAEADLHRAVSDLQRSNAELQQFGYVVSHDLKEPLRMIASYCQLLERRCRDKLGPDAREYIGFAVDGAERMQRMIDDLLSYTRLSTSERHTDLCDLNQVLGQCQRNLKLAIEDAGATLEVGSLPSVRGDRTQLLLLFQNLITNALKFRREDEPPRITVSAAPAEVESEDGSSTPGPHWAIQVSDNGIGIPADSLENIFLIFHRLRAGKDRQGTGIGLAICRKIVDNHGGAIMVESEPGVGSVFTIALPATASEDESPA